jgi:RNA polymerase sigma-70 factor, ECF subfamily
VVLATPSQMNPAPALAANGLPTPRALYEAEADYVWNTLRRLGVSSSDIEDQTHEVFMAAFRQLHRYDPGRPIRPWLFGFAVKVASHFRRQARHRHEIPGDLPVTPDGKPHPEEAATAAQDRQRLQAALEILDLPKRAVVVLHEIEGRPIPEVAEILGIPVNTAYSRLRLARAELIRLFSPAEARS